MSTGESESQLITAAIEGDRAALAQLLLLHYDALHVHVDMRILPEVQGLIRAEDILQQTFVRAAQAIASFEDRHEGAFRAWLKTIANNLVRDANKRRRRERREGAFDSSVSPRLNRLMGALTSPSRRAAHGENVRSMKEAMVHLPDDQQDVLRRRYLLGQSLDQIAAATGRSKDGVRGLCFRARKNLRSVMGRSSLYFSS
jgi:RNA polymerase sigma-70 factor (ECF subfamily)